MGQTDAKWGRLLIGLVVLAVLAVGPARPARADELIVFSAGAVRAIVTELSEAFRQEIGHAVALSFGTVGVTRGKIASGAPVDVVIMTDTAVADVIRGGGLGGGSRPSRP